MAPTLDGFFSFCFFKHKSPENTIFTICNHLFCANRSFPPILSTKYPLTEKRKKVDLPTLICLGMLQEINFVFVDLIEPRIRERCNKKSYYTHFLEGCRDMSCLFQVLFCIICDY